jgi:hypothetical protein
MTKPKTKTEKLVTLLETGKVLTAAQIAKRTGLQNVSATVDRLRNQARLFPVSFRNEKGQQVYAAY